MNAQWKYQIRIYLDGDLAQAARFDPGSQKLKWLSSVLAKHRAKLRCQFDLFAEHVAEAERVGTGRLPSLRMDQGDDRRPYKKSKICRNIFALRRRSRSLREGNCRRA
jgi:hypothetical protein